MTGSLWRGQITRGVRRLVSIKAIVIGFVILGSIYGVAAPVFEKPDEIWHFAYIKRLVDGRGFPTAPIAIADDSPAQESSQPPLYYMAAALAVRFFVPDTSDWTSWLQRNPAFPYVYGGQPNDNKNVLIHAAPEIFPYQGTARALHIARMVALLFGALTVWATYHFALEIWPDRPAVGLLSGAVVAFTPQFLFISSAASNDAAAAALCASSLWATVRIMRRGLTTRRALAFGALLALAALSKASAVALIPVAGLAVIVVDRRSWPMRFRQLAIAAGIAALLAGPWYAHTLIEFGDLLGTSPHLMMAWARSTPLSVTEAIARLPTALVSYWLAFGWGNILAPDWLYALMNVLFAAAGAGVLAWLMSVWRNLQRSPQSAETRLTLVAGVMAVAWVGLIVGALVRWIQLLDAALGRLLFPAEAALAVLLVAGWMFWARQASRVAVVPLALLAASVVAVPSTLLAAYAPPPTLSLQTIEQRPGRAVDIRYGDIARLIRVNAPRDHWPQPGQGFYVDLCWEPLARDDRQLMVLVQIIGENNQLISSRRTMPGLGSYPIGVWQPGGRFCDKVHVQLNDTVRAPAIYQVEVSFIDQVTNQRLPAVAPDGTTLSTNFVDTLKVAPAAYAVPAIENPVNYRLGDQIELIGYDLRPAQVQPGQAARLRLYWRAVRPPDLNYTVFVHVPMSATALLAQADSPPQTGAYPTTFWDAGEVVSDEHVIAIGPEARSGQYPIVVGLYNPLDGARLPLMNNATQTEIQLPGRLVVK